MNLLFIAIWLLCGLITIAVMLYRYACVEGRITLGWAAVWTLSGLITGPLGVLATIMTCLTHPLPPESKPVVLWRRKEGAGK